MANKSQTQEATTSTTPEPLNALTQIQEAGLGSLMGMSTAWVEAISGMGAEVANFVADRIKEDVKTQHQVLHCKNVADLHNIQAEFIQNAMSQYQAETGKLLKMGTEAFASSTDGKSN